MLPEMWVAPAVLALLYVALRLGPNRPPSSGLLAGGTP